MTTSQARPRPRRTVTHVLQKLNLRDRVQAVVLAYQTGLYDVVNSRDQSPRG